MKRRRSASERLAIAGMATATAAGATIAHRGAMLAAARDAAAFADPEFTRMGHEKLEAAAAAATAMTLAAPLFSLRFLEWSWSVGQRTQWALAAAAAARSLPALALVQRQWASALASANLRLFESAAGVAAAGLRPVHRTAAANARRLGRRRAS
jgi:hypothetical protein